MTLSSLFAKKQSEEPLVWESESFIAVPFASWFTVLGKSNAAWELTLPLP